MHLALQFAASQTVFEALCAVHRLHVALVEHFFDHARAVCFSIGGYLIADFSVLKQEVA